MKQHIWRTQYQKLKKNLYSNENYVAIHYNSNKRETLIVQTIKNFSSSLSQFILNQTSKQKKRKKKNAITKNQNNNRNAKLIVQKKNLLYFSACEIRKMKSHFRFAKTRAIIHSRLKIFLLNPRCRFMKNTPILNKIYTEQNFMPNGISRKPNAQISCWKVLCGNKWPGDVENQK